MPHRRPAPRPRGCLSKTIAAAGLSAPRAGVAADRIDEVITTNSSIIEKAEKETIEKHTGKVEFHHVTSVIRVRMKMYWKILILQQN